MALKDIGWHEQLCMHNKIKIVQVKLMLDKFFSKLESSETENQLTKNLDYIF